MVMLAAAFLMVTAQVDGNWTPLPSGATISRMFFACGTFPSGDYYSLLLRKDADDDSVRIHHVPRGENTGSEIVLTGAMQSLAWAENADTMRYRAEYNGNDQTGVPTRLTVMMIAPQPVASNGVRTATFTLVRGNQRVTQTCSAAPPPPEVPS
jgi:hypothetical protein